MIVLVAVWIPVRYRGEYKTWNITALPAHLQVLGRNFYPAGPAVNRASIEKESQWRAPLRRIGSVNPLPFIPVGEKSIVAQGYSTPKCTTAVYITVGPDSYMPYGLSGSC